MMTKRFCSGLFIFTVSFIFSLSRFVQASVQKRIYVYVSDKMTWSAAQKYCMEYYTDLATFRTKNELETLKALLGLDIVCWIGLQKTKNGSNVWIWSDGEDITFTEWGYGEPNNYDGVEDCAIMRAGSWYDISCNNNFDFLCYEDEPILVQENKTWEEALDHCRALDSDPNSSNIYSNYVYDLLHLDYKGFNSSARSVIRDAQTQEVWIGLRFLAGNWLWVNPQQVQLPACPAPGKYCGTMTKTGKLQFNNCLEKRNFFCAKN